MPTLLTDDVIFFGGPPAHYIEKKPGWDQEYVPICGSASIEIFTHDSKYTECWECCSILGITPPGLE